MTRSHARHVARLPLAVLTVVAAAAASLGAGPAGARPQLQTPQFHTLGCFQDPLADVALAEADVVDFCVNYQGAALVLVLEAATPTDPAADAGWTQAETQARLALSVDGDEQADFELTVRGGDDLSAEVRPVGGGESCAAQRAVFDGRRIVVQAGADCIGAPVSVRAAVSLTYQADAGAEPVTDRAPDAGLVTALTNEPPPEPVCAPAATDDASLVVIIRVACGVGGTEPISQAVATSEFVFDEPLEADWAVLARDDDFADALAGSALGFGQGPLLFTPSPASAPPGGDPGRLAGNTRTELLRVLPRGRTVYVLGGAAALDPGVDLELQELGYRVLRFAGSTREATAALIAGEVRALVDEFVRTVGFPDTRSVLVATRSNWPDAVVAGSVAAYWGMPILLTPADAIHPETAAALQAIRPEFIHVIGGSAVISRDVFIALQDFATGSPERGSFCDAPEQSFPACRWAGENRVRTAQAVGELNRALLGRYGDNALLPTDATYGAAVNLFRGDAFTHALSASAVSGRFGGAVFVPLNGDGGDAIDASIEFWLCEFLPDLDFLLAMGDTDVVADAAGQAIRDQVERGCSPAT